MKPIEFRVYLKEPTLCVVENLKAYLQKTKPFRKHYELFHSYQKPYAPVGKDTIARWCKEMMYMAGIDINKYSCHSSRFAASSFAFSEGISLKATCDAAGWSSERTFSKFYQKEVEEENMASAMLP